jgi:hypothetical protein
LLRRPAFIGDRFACQIDDGINIIEVMMPSKPRHKVTRASSRVCAFSGLRVETVT